MVEEVQHGLDRIEVVLAQRVASRCGSYPRVDERGLDYIHLGVEARDVGATLADPNVDPRPFVEVRREVGKLVLHDADGASIDLDGGDVLVAEGDCAEDIASAAGADDQRRAELAQVMRELEHARPQVRDGGQIPVEADHRRDRGPVHEEPLRVRIGRLVQRDAGERVPAFKHEIARGLSLGVPHGQQVLRALQRHEGDERRAESEGRGSGRALLVGHGERRAGDRQKQRERGHQRGAVEQIERRHDERCADGSAEQIPKVESRDPFGEVGEHDREHETTREVRERRHDDQANEPDDRSPRLYGSRGKRQDEDVGNRERRGGQGHQPCDEIDRALTPEEVWCHVERQARRAQPQQGHRQHGKRHVGPEQDREQPRIEDLDGQDDGRRHEHRKGYGSHV